MSTRARLSSLRLLSILLLVLGGGAALFFSLQDSSPASPSEQAPASAAPSQTPFARAGSSLKASFLPQLCMLSAADLAALPLVDGFESPLGTPTGAFVYDAQSLGSDNPKRGGAHLGADLNGIGGGSTDEGMPVYASARGLVVYSGCPSPDWGNVVILAHRCPDGRVVQSLYAHLKERQAKRGAMLARGEHLGTVGGADGRYVPHLHFELIESIRIEAALPGYLAHASLSHFSLAEAMSRYPAPLHGDAFQSIRRQQARSVIELRPL